MLVTYKPSQPRETWHNNALYYDKHFYALGRISFSVMLSAITLNVIKRNVVKLNIIMLIVVTTKLEAGNTKGGRGKYHCTVDLLFDWFGINCMTIDNFRFYLQNRLIQTSPTGGRWYSDTSHFSVPC